MDEGDDEEDDEDAIALERDVEIIERAMEEEIEKATKKGKPVRQVLFKVSLLHYFFFFLASFLLPLYFPSSFFDIVFLLSIHRFFFGFRCLPGLLSPLLLPVFFFSHHLLCFSIRRFFFWLSIPPRSSISTFLFLCVALRFLPSSFFFFFFAFGPSSSSSSWALPSVLIAFRSLFFFIPISTNDSRYPLLSLSVLIAFRSLLFFIPISTNDSLYRLLSLSLLMPSLLFLFKLSVHSFVCFFFLNAYVVLIFFFSFENLHTPSKIRQPSSYLGGLKSFYNVQKLPHRKRNLPFARCLGMFVFGGTRPTTCLSLHIPTATPLTK